MKKLLLLVLLIASSLFASAQHLETFDNETNNVTSFSTDGQVFSVTSAQSFFRVQGGYPGTGWNGVANDNKYLDNSAYTSSSAGVNFSISSVPGFRMQTAWVYISTSGLNLSPTGTITFTGFLNGVQKFSVSRSNPFNPSASVNNGFTKFDFASVDGQDVTQINIDKLTISTTSGIGYLSFDAFTWNDKLVPPTVATGAVSNVAASSATVASSITAAGNPAVITEYGAVYGTSNDPTTANSKAVTGTSATSGTNYNANLTGLLPVTMYYARAYATNATGTAYGTSVSFTTPKADQAITFAAFPSKTYGNADFAPVATATSGLTISYSSDNTDVATIVNGNIHIVGAGTANITADQAGNTTNNAATSVVQVLTISKRPLEITPDAQTKIYGDAEPASYPYRFTNGTSLASGDGMSGPFIRAVGETPGTYALSIGTKHPVNTSTGADLSSNYAIAFVSSNLTITKRVITMAPVSRSKTYGDADPYLNAFSITVGSIAPGHNTSGAFARIAGENAGTYSIAGIGTKFITNDGGYTNVNEYYDITILPGTFTINAKPITVNATAQSKSYNDADPELTYTTDVELASGDSFTGALSRAAGENVGSYAISQNTLALNSNYLLTYTGANLTIGKKAINVTADALSKAYGDADPALTYTTDVTLPAGDSFSGNLERAAGEAIGNYAIGQGTLALSNSNYALNFIGKDFTIDKRTIDLYTVAQYAQFGNADDVIGYYQSGSVLVNGDVLTGAPGREPGTAIGAYATTIGTLAVTNSQNYILNFHSTAYNITQREVTVSGGSYIKIYGEADPALNFIITSGSLLGGAQITGALTRPAGETSGPYAVLQGTLAINDSNYKLIYQGGYFEIDRAPLTIHIDNKTKVATKANPVLTYTVTGFKNGDTEASAITPAIQLGTYVTETSPAGDYPIYVSSNVFALNYNISSPNGTLTVTPASSVNTLASAVIPGAVFDSTFNSAKEFYQVTLPNGTTSTTLTVTATDPLSTISVGAYPAIATPIASGAPYTVTLHGNNTEQVGMHVTAEDGTIKSYFFNIGAEPSDSKLAFLYTDFGLVDGFTPNNIFYTLKVPAETDSLNIYPIANDSLATVRVNGGEGGGVTGPRTIGLREGGNNVRVVVKSADNTSTTPYSLYITRAIRLKTLTVSAGTLLPAFDPNVTSYVLKVPAGVPDVTVSPTGNETYFQMLVNGAHVNYGEASAPVTINEDGSTTIAVQITAGDGVTTKIYNIKVRRGEPAADLANLTFYEGTATPAFDPDVTEYELNLPADSRIAYFIPTFADPNATVTVDGNNASSGEFSYVYLSEPNPTVPVIVTAQNGTTKQYNVTIKVPISTNAKLSSISVYNNGTTYASISPDFDPEIHTYTLDVPSTVTSARIIPNADSQYGKIKINGVPYDGYFGTAFMPGANVFTFEVTAQDSVTTETYTLTVNRSLPTNNELYSLTISQGTLSPAFNTNTLNYTATVPNNITNLDVTALTADTSARFKINGVTPQRYQPYNVALTTGQNTITVQVAAKNGATKDYVVTVTRELSANALLANLSINQGTLAPAFDEATIAYTASVPNSVSELSITPTLSDTTASIKVNGTTAVSGAATAVTLQTGDNVIPVEVTAQDGTTQETYTLTVNRALSSDNYLASLTSSAGRFLFAFNKDNGFNQILVPNDVSTFTVTPVTSDARATIRIAGYAVTSGMASQPLTIGTSYQIVVTAEDGTERYYTVWPKYLSTNANLSLLSTTAGVITPTFNANTLSYSLTVPAGVSGANINAYLADSTARISLNGAPKRAYGYYDYSVPLAYGINTLQLAVTPQEGADKVYTITITRTPASANANLSKIALSQQSTLTSTTGTANYNYNMVVSSTATSATLTLTAQDADAKVAIDGATGTAGSATGTVAIGASAVTVNIEVTAADGTTKKTYKIAVVKAASANAYLDKIVLSQPSTLSTTAGTANYNYNMVVNSSATSATLSLTAQDAGAKVAINGATGTVGSATGTVAIGASPTIVEIEVTAADGTTKKTYHIAVVKAPSANAYLDKIVLNESSVLSGTTGTANYNYNMVIKSAAGTAILSLTAQDADAKIAINGGTATVGTASTTVANSETPVVTEIEVTAADGITKKTYKITSVKAPSANANLDKMLWDQPSTLTVTTGTANYNYNSILSSSAATATLSITAQDANASISVNGSAGVLGSFNAIVPISETPVVTNIEITAADGVTKRTYRVTSTKAPSKNANLSKIAVNLPSTLSATTGPADHNYNSVVTGTSTNGFLKLTAQDAAAKISINGAAATVGTASAPVTIGATATVFSIEVTAEDGTTKITYQVTVSKAGPPVVAATGNNKNQINLVQKPEQPTTDTQLEELIVKQAVSPNGDGINDRFTIEGISAFPENTVRVMNRNGDVIYEAKGYDNESKAFDGRNSKGVMQQAGTYFYSIEYKKDGESKRKTGYIVLKY